MSHEVEKVGTAQFGGRGGDAHAMERSMCAPVSLVEKRRRCSKRTLQRTIPSVTTSKFVQVPLSIRSSLPFAICGIGRQYASNNVVENTCFADRIQ